MKSDNNEIDVLFVTPNNSKAIYQELANSYSAIEPQHGLYYWLNHVDLKGSM